MVLCGLEVRVGCDVNLIRPVSNYTDRKKTSITTTIGTAFVQRLKV